MRRFLLALALGFVCSTVAHAGTFRIADGAIHVGGNDRGGQIGPYLKEFAKVRNSGLRVVLKGTCLSACTLVLGTVPHHRICVMPETRLGFHAAWDLEKVTYAGRTVEIRKYSPQGTALLWEIYPTHIRSWIKRKGGLGPEMIYLKGAELTKMYRQC
jgi:hypothetical protein